MSLPCSTSPLRRASLLGTAIFLAASLASAQSESVQNQSTSAGFSPSTESSSLQSIASIDPGAAAAFPSAPASASAASGQQNPGGYRHRIYKGFAFEAGGGFNAPFGNDTPYITWGGNFTVGGGVRFSNRLSALLEYQFIDNKLPGAFIASAGQGASGGNAHFNAITGSPVFDLTPKWSNGVYLTGGFGYYHKSTNFNVTECCDFEGYPVTINTTSFTSNQMGGNAGFGIYHRVGGLYGESHTQIFAETRYLFVHTPPLSETNGLGTTELIPVTLGVRF